MLNGRDFIKVGTHFYNTNRNATEIIDVCVKVSHLGDDKSYPYPLRRGQKTVCVRDSSGYPASASWRRGVIAYSPTRGTRVTPKINGTDTSTSSV